MKKTITLLAATLVLMVSEIQASRLFLTTNASRATAHIAGQKYFSHNGIFQINQLYSGVTFVRVVQQGNGNRDGHQRGRGFGEIFRGQIVIPHESDVYARISHRGGLIIDRVVSRRRTPRGNSCDTRPRQGRGTDYGRDGQHYDNRNRDQRGRVRTPAPRSTRVQSNYSVALRMINQASFDSEKRTIAKQYLRDNNITSQEVLDMIRAFDFESSRLELAKLAYRSTVDPENYFIVNQGFQFSSSSSALNRYIR